MSGNTTTYALAVNTREAMVSLDNISQETVRTISTFSRLSSAIQRITGHAASFSKISQGLQSFSGKLNDAITPGISLNTSLTGLSATTGITGKGLEEIEGHARETAKIFGGSATQSVESYKLLLAQLSPELAKTPAALKVMGYNIATLSKIMGGNSTAATEVLTTAINQYGVSLTDPMAASSKMTEMMNVMAAAAQKGAGLPAIKSALQESGKAAKTENVHFAETNAAIQVLDKAGKKGSEGGIALRNVLASLSQSRFLPQDVQEELSSAGVNVNSLTDKTLTLSERLKPLQSIIHNDVLITKLFGKENSNAALALLSGLDTMDNYTVSIQGTSAATSQAGIIMKSFSEKISRQKAWLDDLKISFFNFSGSIIPYLKGAVTAFQGVTSVITGLNTLYCFSETQAAKAIVARTRATLRGTAAIFGSIRATISSIVSMGAFNAFTLISVATTYAFAAAIRAVGKAIYSIPIIGWIAAGISLLITAFKLLWDKCEGFRRILFAIWETLKAVFYNIGVVITAIWDNVLKPVFTGLWNLVTSVASGIMDGLQWCWDGITAGFSVVGDFFTGLWDDVMSGITAVRDFFTGIWNWITENCSGVAAFISSVFSSITQPICDAFAPVWEFVSGIFNKIGEVVSNFFDWIGRMWNKIFPKDKFKSLNEAAEKGLAAGSESFRKNQAAKGEQITGLTELPANNIKRIIESGTDPGSLPILNSNTIRQEPTGNSAASRLAAIKIPSLAKATATIALPLAMASPGSEPIGLPAQQSAFNRETSWEYGMGNSPVSLDKFCDKIEIHIASADNQGQDEITTVVTDALRKVFNNI